MVALFRCNSPIHHLLIPQISISYLNILINLQHFLIILILIMNKYRLSMDSTDSLSLSRNESELERLRFELKENQVAMNEKNTIIGVLRQRVKDWEDASEESDKTLQLLHQKACRLEKEVAEKNEESEAISHALKEVETANDLLSKKVNARTTQVQKLTEALTTTKNELDEQRSNNERLKHKIELLELEVSSGRKKVRENNNDQTHDEMIQELYDLRAKVKSLSHQQSRRSIDENILKLRHELEVTETSWKLERQHKERYARENLHLERKIHELSKELQQLKEQMSSMAPPPPPPSVPVKDKNLEATAAIHFSMAEEVGEIMDSSSVTSVIDKYNSRTTFNTNDSLKTVKLPQRQQTQNYCINHRIQKSSFLDDPIAIQKMHAERAQELARRNMKTKPLHQTSYPLELDTFDTTGLTEKEIKSGNVMRPALADYSNQTKPVFVRKKPEAFIV